MLNDKTLSNNMEVDLFRLSMLSRLIAKTIDEEAYSKWIY